MAVVVVGYSTIIIN